MAFSMDSLSFWNDFEEVIFPPHMDKKADEDMKEISEIFNLSNSNQVLDLCCGKGRNTIALAKLGIPVTGLDFNENYLDQASKKAEAESLQIDFTKGDMKDFLFPNKFDLIMSMYTSFGYFENIEDEKKVLKNIISSLKDNGALIIELMSKEILARIFKPKDWFQLGDKLFLQEREIVDDWKVIKNKYFIIKDGQTLQHEFSHRLYSAFELEMMLKEAGFSSVKFYRDFKKSSFNEKANRLIVFAYK